MFVTDDFHPLIQQLATVEQFIKIHHPIAEVVDLLKDAGSEGIVEVELARREQSPVLDTVPITLDVNLDEAVDTRFLP